MNSFQQRAHELGYVPVSSASIDARVSFIRKTYAHLLGALIAFAGMSFGIQQLPFIDDAMMMLFSQGMWAWLFVLGGFALVGFIADWWAHNMESKALQYAGLGLYVVAEAAIFTPMFYIAQGFEGAIPSAALITAVVFAGLTVSVFVTRADFSFLRMGLIVASFLGLGAIVAGALFGFTLGLWFSVFMVLIASGSILYYTSNILHHYNPNQYVAAALSLFSAVALLFWYVLRIVMAFSGD